MTKDKYEKNYKKYINDTQLDDFMSSTTTELTATTSGGMWSVNPLTTGDSWYSDGTTTNPHIIGDDTHGGMMNIPFSTGNTTYEYPAHRTPGTEEWPIVSDALGIVYIEGDEIKIRMADGKTIVIGRLDDGEDFVPIEVVAAKKKLIDE